MNQRVRESCHHMCIYIYIHICIYVYVSCTVLCMYRNIYIYIHNGVYCIVYIYIHMYTDTYIGWHIAHFRQWPPKGMCMQALFVLTLCQL